MSRRTCLYERHRALGAVFTDFAGWQMPLQYAGGIVQEHLETRRRAGIFDVSHMGRFRITGEDALHFLQQVLSNNAAALNVGEAQYTLLPDAEGGALDDAYLYRFAAAEYLLVVNASNREKDWDHLRLRARAFPGVGLADLTAELAMLSLQGPESRGLLAPRLEGGSLPEPFRNRLSQASWKGAPLWISRTGYTGEPIGFELFCEPQAALSLWDALVAAGAVPVGLGARDTLRLEAGLPLYGHELGRDPQGEPIPVFACPTARAAVSFSPLKGDFVGREPLARQFEAWRRFVARDFSLLEVLPRLLRPVALIDRGVARAGAPVLRASQPAGWVTSGTMVPYWVTAGQGLESVQSEEKGMRAIGLALIDSDLEEGDEIEIDIRGRPARAVIVPAHLRNEAPPRAWPVLWHEAGAEEPEAASGGDAAAKAAALVGRAIDNHRWRQQRCINLIPSEQTPSRLVRLLSITDPVGRYAEHKALKAFREADVFFYQGTGFIAEVERALVRALRGMLGCRNLEVRPISGQMANMAVYGALVDFLNRADRRREPRRLRAVMNHPIIRGGHLSAQPSGALKDFVMRESRRERPAVVPFPVRPEDPFRIDLAATRRLIAEIRPELVILGRSLTIYREPVAEIRSALQEAGVPAVLMYDAAHGFGLLGPRFQQPFAEGADILTASTHKTFFGTQRGVIACDFAPRDPRYPLWEAVQRRVFPGSLSNHHLGTLLGLLAAVYETERFGDAYREAVIANAKAFARALADAGLRVAGDPACSFTETHQVIVLVGYARGPRIARRLEENHILLNYQAAPDEEGFTASGALRMGVQEMTRFGMGPADFAALAQLLADCILRKADVREEVVRLRQRFAEMRFCFTGPEAEAWLARLRELT